MSYNQDLSNAEDIFSSWYNPQYQPEIYPFLPCDLVTVDTGVPLCNNCVVNSLSLLVDSPTHQWSSSDSSPFIQSGGFCFSETLQSIEHTEIQESKTLATQHTSLGSTKPRSTVSVTTCTSKIAPLTATAPEAEVSSSDDRRSAPPVKLLPRKPGRPKINRDYTCTKSTLSNTTSTSTHLCHPGRLPHKQIERKYRDGLNLEIERLRKAVPTLLQSTDSGLTGVAKSSKGVVLAAAIK
ncbi:hypothetical protein IQ06DRAFT_353988 [Phaeosphaeriaceae sp. SRC1lsM3a]|nr:hypothetical protein IQ06DRAFT_353988 [Stagonospora sp. SRC1lsM3a]